MDDRCEHFLYQRFGHYDRNKRQYHHKNWMSHRWPKKKWRSFSDPNFWPKEEKNKQKKGTAKKPCALGSGPSGRPALGWRRRRSSAGRWWPCWCWWARAGAGAPPRTPWATTPSTPPRRCRSGSTSTPQRPSSPTSSCCAHTERETKKTNDVKECRWFQIKPKDTREKSSRRYEN